MGLVPGLGDTATTGVSLWMLYEAMRFGLPWRVLARMVANIAVEATFGAVPILGDVFDAVWHANRRNYALIEANYHAGLRSRSFRQIAGVFAVVALLFMASVVAVLVLFARVFVYLVNL